VWFRLRRVLADARAAYVVSGEDARRLMDEGYRFEPCGGELAPPKTLVFVSETRLSTLASRREIAVALGADFLLAGNVALVPFDKRGGRPTD
jgi:hypothetical protein